jgi:hypothetical protein
MIPESPAGSSIDPEFLPPETPASTPDWSIVPVPIIYADPNLGFGIGLMPVGLVHPEDRIEWILAPSFDYNELLGVSFTNRIYYYPTLQEELFVYNDWATSGKFEHEARFRGRDRFVRNSSFTARGYIVKDPTRRFYGLGAGTEEDDETDYEINESAVDADIGYNLTDWLRPAFTFRWRHSRIEGGKVDNTPDTPDIFPDVGGVNTREITSVIALGGRLTFDFRDDATIPSKGLYLDFYGEASAKGAVSNTHFWRWGINATGYLPIGLGETEDFFVTVGRIDYQQLTGDDSVPFWEFPTLGGRAALRGFGVGRFTDEGALFFSVEQRARVWEVEIRDNNLRIEVAAFLDVGRVFGSGSTFTDRDWQYVPGVGARILIPESGIIARGDVGFGGEGPAIFLVLGYPF